VRCVRNLKIEQRSVTKSYCKFGKSATEAIEGLKMVYGDECLSRASVFEWFAKFHAGRESIEDDPRPGLPVSIQTEENIEKVFNLMSEDRRITTRMTTDMLDVNKEMAGDILKKLFVETKDWFAFRAAQLDPGAKTNKQKKRINCCRAFIKSVEEDADIFKRIVTDDESLCFQYDPETKRQSMEWRSTNSPGQNKIRLQKCGFRIMLIVFFDTRGIIHKQFVPQGTTVNSHCYLGVFNVCTGACVE
jgi:hypothetical protein